MTASSFPDFITARRRELQLTLGDVAASLGVSPITVSNWSNGNAKPNTKNLVALAELLDVSPDELADMAGVTLKSPTEGVNLMPSAEVETDDEPLTEETDTSEPIAEIRFTEPRLVADPPEEVEGVAADADEVPIPDLDDPPEEIQAVAADADEVPIPDLDDPPEEIQAVAADADDVPIPDLDDPPEEIQAVAADADDVPIPDLDDPPEEIQAVAADEDDVPIPDLDDPPEEIQAVAADEDDVPIPDLDDPPEEIQAVAADQGVTEPETETGQVEPVEEAEAAADNDPALVATAATTEKAPAPSKRPGSRRREGRAPAATERQVTTLPLTYIEDPKQLMRYRIRWAMTVVVLAIMFFVLLWASRELLSALSEVKQAVTPGGIGG